MHKATKEYEIAVHIIAKRTIATSEITIRATRGIEDTTSSKMNQTIKVIKGIKIINQGITGTTVVINSVFLTSKVLTQIQEKIRATRMAVRTSRLDRTNLSN